MLRFDLKKKHMKGEKDIAPNVFCRISKFIEMKDVVNQ